MSETGPMVYDGPAEKPGVAAKRTTAQRPSTNVPNCRRVAGIVPLPERRADSAAHGSGRQAGSVALTVATLSEGAARGGGALAHLQAPVIENQAGGSPVPAVTNTIGAKHGLGRLTLPLNWASPVEVAGNGAVTRFTTTAAASAID